MRGSVEVGGTGVIHPTHGFRTTRPNGVNWNLWPIEGLAFPVRSGSRGLATTGWTRDRWRADVYMADLGCSQPPDM